MVPVIIVLFSAYFTAVYFVNLSAGKRLDSFASEINKYVVFEYGHTSINPFKVNLVISDIVLKQDELNQVKVRQAVIRKIDTKSQIPSCLDVAFNDIDIINNEKSFKTLISEVMGFGDGLRIDLRLSYSYKESSKEFELKTLEISSKNAGKVSLSFQLSGIVIDSSLPGRIFSEENPVFLNNAEIRFIDDSVTDRGFKLIADTIDMETADFKALLNMQIDYVVKSANLKLSDASLSKLKGFIKEPDKITVTAIPPQPVPLSMLSDNYNKPFRIANILNIDFK